MNNGVWVSGVCEISSLDQLKKLDNFKMEACTGMILRNLLFRFFKLILDFSAGYGSFSAFFFVLFRRLLFPFALLCLRKIWNEKNERVKSRIKSRFTFLVWVHLYVLM